MTYHRKCNKTRTETATTLLSLGDGEQNKRSPNPKQGHLNDECISLCAFWPHYVLFSFCFSVADQLFATVSSSWANVLTVRSSASGMIYSNRDGSHSDNMYCSWSISSSTNLELIFFRFDTESSFDFVYVYDGRSSSSPLIGQYHGNSLPSAITSSSNQLFVIFTSDSSNVRSGFAASYHGKEYLHSCWPWEITANWKKGKLLRIKKIKETIVVSIALKVKIVRHCSRCNTNLNV